MLGQGMDPGHIKDHGLKDRHRHDSATFGSIGSSSEGSLKENRPDNNNTDHLSSKNINGKRKLFFVLKLVQPSQQRHEIK